MMSCPVRLPGPMFLPGGLHPGPGRGSAQVQGGSSSGWGGLCPGPGEGLCPGGLCEGGRRPPRY